MRTKPRDLWTNLTSDLARCQRWIMHTSRWKRLRGKLRQDSGDVPGWVLITLMTAGLVIVIWGLAGPALANVFQQAIDRVTGF
jgi:hypothetical protein